jgi:outer membrane protein TolC
MPAPPYLFFQRHTRRLIPCLLTATLAACQAPAPDIARDAATLTGLENAITFRQYPDDHAPVPSDTLSLADAVRHALANDPRLQIALAKIRTAHADAAQARLLPNPILNIDLRFPTQAGSNTAVEATLSADLLALLQKPGLIAAADKRLRAAASDALTVTLDLLEEVQESYAAVASADAEIANAQSRLDILRRLRTLAAERVAAGEGTRLDTLTLDAQLAQAALDLADLRQSATQDRLHLARLLGTPRDPAQWHLTSPDLPPATLAPESLWIDLALDRRPEIAAKRWELLALGDDLKAASFSPFTGGEVGVHLEHDPEYRVGPNIAVPLPIFDWGQASRAKLTAQRIAARHDLAQQQQEIIQDVRSAYASYRHASDALATTQDTLLPLQREQLNLAQRTYRAGESDLTTLLLAESELQSSLSREIELREKRFVAALKLQRAAGGAGIAAPLMPAAAPASQPSPPTSRPATGPLP